MTFRYKIFNKHTNSYEKSDSCHLVSITLVRDDLLDEVLCLAIRVGACTGWMCLTQWQRLGNPIDRC